MSIDSKYFDGIRISPNRRRFEEKKAAECEWQGCENPGGYRAPKGRHQEGKYHNFCIDHVREYNKKYNYFAGMADDEIIDYQRSASTGHRPTWNVGVGKNGSGKPDGQPSWTGAFADPFGFFGGDSETRSNPEPKQRPLGNFERRSFEALDLEGTENGTTIKARYKELVKRLHPDANGGDRSLEDRLREIIQAYNYLKSAGFC